ncbi:hypothetical protein PVMG_04602 [Plasmodium vivax Mauritania I]|uniref:Variable surface protein Vir7-like protein n=1 Tax=Plasmodium vivax Mauritania I TaxID=1035515 RepID=A0A0J9T563_PLAVI|nr:hypothetical protein PVMG_04602 [Plasmodium vivax Mauritania I]
MYDELNKNVDDDENRNLYDALCDQIIKKSCGQLSKHKDACMKLVRNLGFYSMGSIYFKYNYDRCNILYNWIYNSIQKGKTTDDIIKNCYYEYIQGKESIQNKNTCIYHSYKDDYEEPENIMLLNIFISYIGDTKITMNGENNILKSSCLKYICEFVNIYKKMFSEYCHEKGSNDQKQQITCAYLSKFKENYNIFLFSQLNEKDKIPSLEKVEEEYMHKCQMDEQRLALRADVHDEGQRFSHPRRDTREGPHTFPYQPALSNSDPNNSMSSTVSTAVGTVAGASSILALLYKVTQNFI